MSEDLGKQLFDSEIGSAIDATSPDWLDRAALRVNVTIALTIMSIASLVSIPYKLALSCATVLTFGLIFLVVTLVASTDNGTEVGDRP